MQKEEKKSNKEFLKKRQFNRMTEIQIEELIQREKVDEMEVIRGKNNKLSKWKYSVYQKQHEGNEQPKQTGRKYFQYTLL